MPRSRRSSAEVLHDAQRAVSLYHIHIAPGPFAWTPCLTWQIIIGEEAKAAQAARISGVPCGAALCGISDGELPREVLRFLVMF